MELTTKQQIAKDFMCSIMTGILSNSESFYVFRESAKKEGMTEDELFSIMALEATETFLKIISNEETERPNTTG